MRNVVLFVGFGIVACSNSGTGSTGDTSTATDTGGDSTTVTSTTSASDTGSTTDTGPLPDVTNTSANIQFTVKEQQIDGFGISNAWHGAPAAAIATQVYDGLFSVTKGAGLSVVRNRIPFRENECMSGYDDKFINKNTDGTYSYTTSGGVKTFSLNWGNWDLSGTATMFAALKANSDYQVTQFMSTPWTPPNNSVSKWKLPDANSSTPSSSTCPVATPVSGNATNTTQWYTNGPEVGGYLDPNHYQDYADVLADYALGFKANMGAQLSVLSLQNEPNFACAYESADWSAQQFHDFLAILKTEFTAKGVYAANPNLLVMAPEYQNIKDDLLSAILADTNTVAALGIGGFHEYEFGTGNENSYTPPTLSDLFAANKRAWMTEWSSSAWAADTTITDGLRLARLVHMDLVDAQLSAFLYWYAWDSGNGSLVQVDASNNVTYPQRLYTLGQFARFVRPGWSRVNVTQPATAGVYLSAYRDPTASQIAIVVINTTASSQSLPLSIDAGAFGALTEYRTSATENIANVGTTTAGATVTATLSAQSVTTFVGTAN